MGDRKNKYDILRVDKLVDEEPLLATGVLTVTTSNEETVQVLTAKHECGLWVYGYVVNWASGRRSESEPTSAKGLYRTEKDARLHCIGMMLMYREWLQAESVQSLLRTEHELKGTTLF